MSQESCSSPGRKNRSVRSVALRLLIVALLLAVLFVTLIGPPAPRQITIYTGPEGTTFFEHGHRYAEVLAGNGIDARLVETQGSLDNLDSLVHGDGPRVGFAEAALIRTYQTAFFDSIAAAEAAGAETGAGEPVDLADVATRAAEDPGFEAPEVDLGLESLGALYLEPFWLFAAAGSDIEDEPDLEGLVVFAGREGSGTRVLAEALLRINGLEEVRILELDEGATEDAVAELFRQGEAEVLFIMGSPMSHTILGLLLDPRFRPISLDRAEAYDRRFDFVTKVTLPEGTVNLASNVPSEELKLIASSIQLVAPEDLNPVLVDALLDAANKVHKRSTLFSTRGSYPNGDPASLPLDPTAERFYSEGFAKWRSYVPFALATWIDRFALAFGALAAAAVFLSILPQIIAWPFGLLINRLSKRIVKVEQALDGGSSRAELLADLEAIDADSVHLWVPPTESVTYLEFRQLISDVRDRVLGLSDDEGT
ncbi:MAG: TAXI family TRAP transporter solute-binding subunit [Gemmatimonadota bacterium]